MSEPYVFLELNKCSDAAKYASKCTVWKANGLCITDNKYYKFMTLNCKLTCKFCTDTITYSGKGNNPVGKIYK